MKIYNTLTHSKEEFVPIVKNKVTFYTCGPTVYDCAHIGNLKTYVFEDLLKRTLLLNNYKVYQVMNITDVDDKTIKKSHGKKTELINIAQKYEKLFFFDLNSLNVIKPEKITRATNYIDQMVDFITDLVKKGFAYKAGDDSIYFSIEKFNNYGELSRLNKDGIKAGARVDQDEYDKKNPADFVLWKAWSEDDGEIFWETSLGKGRPGWHIECSVMSNTELGQTIDIHAGAVDLIFPHHENEIAQSECRNGQKFVNFWVHGEHLLVEGKKMSKSLGNLYTLSDLKNKGFSPLDFRYLVLGAHYRSKLDFSWSGLEGAKNARLKLTKYVSDIKSNNIKNIDQKYLDKFKKRINDDLDTPGALAILWELIKNNNLDSVKKYSTLIEMDKILGLDLGSIKKTEIPKKIAELAEKRKQSRKEKRFQEADKLRVELEKNGWRIEDIKNNQYKLEKM